ncbi:unnamed protein product [Soboliphyme baturini]|uniref:AIP3 domain-containing protein n=1 Tax=Soboliphyme baturini TaxID=241478 RepID=A0A183IPA8_9BILA|nr:unnamed protein product [Soboliphyme baturini]
MRIDEDEGHYWHLVFLQYKNETKRAVVPVGGLKSLNDIRSLFLNTFYESITPEYLNSSHIKVYIQDPANTELFYELDDVSTYFVCGVVHEILEETRRLCPRQRWHWQSIKTLHGKCVQSSTDAGSKMPAGAQ